MKGPCDSQSKRLVEEPAFVSRQVVEARRYYIDLQPDPEAECVLVCGGWERLAPEYLLSRETFPFIAVEFVAEGAGMLGLNGKEYHLQPGMVFAYGPEVPHMIRNDPLRPMRKYYIDISGSEVAGFLGDLARWIPVQVSTPQEVVELFDILQREATGMDSLGSQLCHVLVRALLLKIRQRALPYGVAEPRSMAAYERVRRYMEDNFLELRTVEEVASACHLTPMYLSRLFARYARVGAYQFLLRLKMNFAAELLLQRGMLVKQVAGELGFSDAFHFSRVFKRVYGVPPERFIRQSRTI
jgi:AraC-like DNA-binding protein